MPIDPDRLPFLTRVINEQVRPLCGDALVVIANGTILKQGLDNLDAMIADLGDDEIVDDGRAREGILPPTVGELRVLKAYMTTLLEAMTAQPAFALLQKLAARQVRVGG